MESKIICGDSLSELQKLPDESINCVVTSPPYWSLRDYGVEGQLGNENTFEEYIINLCNIFDEVKRVLRKDGTCFVNIGDTYSGSTQGAGKTIERVISKGRENLESSQNYLMKYAHTLTKLPPSAKTSVPAKSLCLIPFRFAIEMVNRGWLLRNTIIWHKRNAMPQSSKDRFTVDFEYVFFFTKNKRYYFEQQFESLKNSSIKRAKYDVYSSKKAGEHYSGLTIEKQKKICFKINSGAIIGRNMRSVWDIPTQGFRGYHFAIFPPKLVIPMIKAGCPELVCKECGEPTKRITNNSERINTRKGINTGTGKSGKELDPHKELHNSDLSRYRQHIIYKVEGYTKCNCSADFERGIVLDPFNGSGTTCLVAKKLARRYIGIDLNPEYCKIAEERLNAVEDILL